MSWAIWVLANLVIKYTLFSQIKFPKWNWMIGIGTLLHENSDQPQHAYGVVASQSPLDVSLNSFPPLGSLLYLPQSSRLDQPKTFWAWSLHSCQGRISQNLAWFLLSPARLGYRKTQGRWLDLKGGLSPFLRMFTVTSVSVSKAWNLSSM